MARESSRLRLVLSALAAGCKLLTSRSGSKQNRASSSLEVWFCSDRAASSRAELAKRLEAAEPAQRVPSPRRRLQARDLEWRPFASSGRDIQFKCRSRGIRGLARATQNRFQAAAACSPWFRRQWLELLRKLARSRSPGLGAAAAADLRARPKPQVPAKSEQTFDTFQRGRRKCRASQQSPTAAARLSPAVTSQLCCCCCCCFVFSVCIAL